MGELVYGTTVRLPGDFFTSSRDDATPTVDFVDDLKHVMRQLRHVSTRVSTAHHTYIPATLPTAKYVFVRHVGVKRPLQRPYDGPLEVADPGSTTFKVDIGSKHDTVAIDRLNPPFLSAARPTPEKQRCFLHRTITLQTTTVSAQHLVISYAFVWTHSVQKGGVLVEEDDVPLGVRAWRALQSFEFRA